MAVNTKRVLIGALAGGVAWTILSMAINTACLTKRYEQAQAAGLFQTEPRIPFFLGIWILMLFALAWIGATLYAVARAAWGPGPLTALKVGVMLGFAAGIPSNFGSATWATFGRIFPFCWAIELGLGAVIATLVAAWLYRD